MTWRLRGATRATRRRDDRAQQARWPQANVLSLPFRLIKVRVFIDMVSVIGRTVVTDEMRATMRQGWQAAWDRMPKFLHDRVAAHQHRRAA